MTSLKRRPDPARTKQRRNIKGVNAPYVPSFVPVVQTFPHKPEAMAIMEMELYRYNRYGVPFALAVFWCDDLEVLKHINDENLKRKTDCTLVFGDGYALAVYAHSNIEAGHKACQNHISNIERLASGVVKISAGLSCISYKSDKDIFSRAFLCLEKAKESPITMVVADGHNIERHNLDAFHLPSV